VKLLWLGMGTEEPDFFHKSIGAFRTMLDKAGIKYVYFSSPGTAHEWLTWRRDLNDFAPRLFQQFSAGNLEGDAVDRDAIVFLPPSYEKDKHRRYPVVYALHGFFIGAEQWSA
jgi:enterochelin esterase-like enzyme